MCSYFEREIHRLFDSPIKCRGNHRRDRDHRHSKGENPSFPETVESAKSLHPSSCSEPIECAMILSNSRGSDDAESTGEGLTLFTQKDGAYFYFCRVELIVLRKEPGTHNHRLANPEKVPRSLTSHVYANMCLTSISFPSHFRWPCTGRRPLTIERE